MEKWIRVVVYARFISVYFSVTCYVWLMEDSFEKQENAGIT